METKIEKPVFEIKPAVSTNALAPTNSMLTPFSPGHPENREEEWIDNECRKRTAIIKAIALETLYAHKVNGFLHVWGTSVVEQTAEKIIEIKNTVSNEELQFYMEQYCTLSLNSLFQHSKGLNEVASSRIAFTIHRDHYPPEEEPPGFFERIFGK